MTFHSINRRQFVAQAACSGLSLATLAKAAASSVDGGHQDGSPQTSDTDSVVESDVAAAAVHTDDKSGSRHYVGEGDYRYEIRHDLFQLPGPLEWDRTNNVAIDSQGRIYVVHLGDGRKTGLPSIFVFDHEGKYIKSFGQKYRGGAHGLEIRKEGSDEFIYVTTVIGERLVAKLTLDGEEVWKRNAPMQSKLYARNDDKAINYDWGRRDNFKPTNIAFLDDNGGFLVADGYGAWVVHRYDKDANYVSTFGKRGKGSGQFRLPHGIWIDDRGAEHGAEKRIVVADRSNNRLQWFSLDGQHLKTMDEFLLPANCATQGNLLLVPELLGRITLIGPGDQIVARLGDDAEYRKKLLADNMQFRREPDRWEAGKFVHPHDACFDAEGNIIVAEWVKTGRVTKLTRV